MNMKKNLIIVFFLAFCLAVKALGTSPVHIYVYGAHNMDITLRNSKSIPFKNDCIGFSACNFSENLGMIQLCVEVDDSLESYKKLKQVLDEVKSKLPSLILYISEDTDKNGIRHVSKKLGDGWNGYGAGFYFQSENIKKIELY